MQFDFSLQLEYKTTFYKQYWPYIYGFHAENIFWKQLGTYIHLWQYGLWSFQTGGTKLERFLPKNQHTHYKLLNFEDWVNGEVSKIEHHFSK